MNLANDCHASTSTQHLHSATDTGTEGAKGKRKMCEPEQPLPPSPLKSTFTPHFQLHSPDTSSRYSPRLVQRMQNDTCFRCRQQGHWARDCPLNSPNSKSRASVADNSEFPKIHCRCGHGYCEVKTVKTERNYGRKYYVCPIKRGKKCSGFVKWCDDPADELDLRPPTYKFPTCSCGAGVCRKEKERNGPNEGRYYFACPIGEDHGACDFRLWEDTLLGNPVIDPAQQSGQRTLNDFWEGSKDGDSPSGHSKRKRITGDSQCSMVKTISELPEGEAAVLKEAPMEGVDLGHTTGSSTPPNHVNFPEFEVVDDLEVIDIINSVPWEAIEKKAPSLSRLSTPSKIRSRQREFQTQITTAAVASFGVFPSFDAIMVPRKESKHDGLCGEFNQLLVSKPGQLVQLSIACHTEISGNEVSLSSSQGSQRKAMSKAQRQRQMVLFMQKELLQELESLNPLDHESMREAAEATFDLLSSLSIDYTQFSEHVWAFINSSSSLAEIETSIQNQNDLSPEEYIQRYEEEKVRLANIREDYVKTQALLEGSYQHSQSLLKEASRLKAILHEVEEQLTSCELESSKMEARLDEINASMVEAEKSLEKAAAQASTARKLREEKKEKQVVAKTALEKAKLELEN